MKGLPISWFVLTLFISFSVTAAQTKATEDALQTMNIEWCRVPGGEFYMGDYWAEDEDPNPYHKVNLDEYYISKHEVTNAQFVSFLNAIKSSITTQECNWGGLELYYLGNPIFWLAQDGEWYDRITMTDEGYRVKPGFEDHPVIEVTWFGADAFCRWLGARLPTEAEWEKAARADEGGPCPWGGFDESLLNHGQVSICCGEDDGDGYLYTAPVSKYPDGKSPYGCLDMAGNVWEWCSDWYDDNFYLTSPDSNPTGPEDGFSKVLRGGSWNSDEENVYVYKRWDYAPFNRMDDLGFRPAKSP
ncbi:SUMF1/EgtB/PvdO family nonheme iron enzyme [candidate division WOR-3 bacterium]|uniref:SUMF1/EgtB/PvdO family nonheme iron enzyme n=1 Tax=candidate division WOR-3 bacterium TaxID=2052148 RepID=A0A9D5K9W2_UNCW3|nr:SUMF1/EgtB/PvdO family nonheme iron enzyme [candidate division WOR-3 bacterium]MBD3365086.1 SUMF1/EgtB/PvdO family nonheme iron enzyme [candidate division WOR-3 bacterium]